MKYENFDQACGLLDQIKKYQETLDSLNSDQVAVAIYTRVDIGKIMTIGAWAGAQHDFSPIAIEFIDGIQHELKIKIERLKQSLEPL